MRSRRTGPVLAPRDTPNAERRPGARGSHLTPRWREMDSNHRSLARKSRFLSRKANCGTERGSQKGCFVCGTDGSNPSPSSGESGANRGLRGDVRHWVCRAARALVRSYGIASSSHQQIVHSGVSAKADFGAVGLSSFRTYPARLSAGYGSFRSGENESSLGKRPRFPCGAGFSFNASDKRAPGSPQPGAVPLQICCAR